MGELNAILSAWQGLEGENRQAVLATVVHVTGSAYRRPGARMLMIPDGRRIGSISGGCLEGEISRKAWWLTESGKPVVRSYDTTSDGDAVWEFGLGCNGVVHVLLERIDTPAATATMRFLSELRRAGSAGVVATVIGPPERAGERVLIHETENFASASQLARAIRNHAQEALRVRKSRLLHLPDADVFMEWVGPAQELVVFGAGHDAVPLVSLAAGMGWKVTVADGRPAYAKADRFPGAHKVVLMRNHDLLEDIPIGRTTAVVMVTHNYPLDTLLLPGIVARDPLYLGMLGPQSRAEKLINDLGLEAPASLHAPAGLDIGSDDPHTIALSIAAEIQAAVSGRNGSMLKCRKGPIHFPPFEVGVGELMYESARPAWCETLVGADV
jgi:xanthine dehydrogenase accessory factor